MTTHPAPSQSSRSAFIVVLTAGFMTLLDVSIVNIALPSIEASLKASPSHLQWIVAGYALSLALSMVPAGRIGDVLGHRKVLITGVAGFALASLMCGTSTDATMLTIYRICQGIAGGFINPQMAGYIQILFTKPQRPKAFGAMGTMVGVSTAIGPTLGGLIIAAAGPHYGWRAIFLINVPIALVVIPMAMKYLPSSHQTGSRYRTSDSHLNLDVGGLVLIAITVLAIMWPFITTHEGHLENAPWWTLAMAPVGLAAFTVWERWRSHHGKAVILPKEVLANPSFMLGALVGMTFFMGQSGYFLTFTLYMQQGLGLPAWVAGLMQAPLALASAIGSAHSGRLVMEYGRRLVLFGQIGVGIGAVVLLIATTQRSVPLIMTLLIIGAFLYGFSRGLTISPNQSLTLTDVPAESGATAAGLLQTMQRIGSSIGITIMTMVFFTTLIREGVSGTQLGSYTRQQLLTSYGNAFASALYVTLGALAISMSVAAIDLLRRRRAQRRAQKAQEAQESQEDADGHAPDTP